MMQKVSNDDDSFSKFNILQYAVYINTLEHLYLPHSGKQHPAFNVSSTQHDHL